VVSSATVQEAATRTAWPRTMPTAGQLRELLVRLPVRQLASQRPANGSAGCRHNGEGRVYARRLPRESGRDYPAERRLEMAVASEDEWYKAAYYKGGSTNAGYWYYPTGSDTYLGKTWPINRATTSIYTSHPTLRSRSTRRTTPRSSVNSRTRTVLWDVRPGWKRVRVERNGGKQSVMARLAGGTLATT